VSAEIAFATPTSAAGRAPGTVVARQTAKRAAQSAALWGYIFGLYVAVSALGYAATYKTPASREKFAEVFASNTALDSLIGRAHRIQTVSGFTAWRCLGVLSVVGAIWGLLAATRLVRGEEDAGRWELLLAGHTTRRQASAQALLGLGAGLCALWSITAVVPAAVGRSSKVAIDPTSALFFALTLVSSAGMFLSIGVLTSQLAPTRRQAAGYAAAVLGVSYALRMVADSGTGLDWLRWATPLGWVEQIQPLTNSDPFALIPIAGLAIGCGGVAVHLSGRRDLGASTVPDKPTAIPRTRLLSGPTGLTIRLVRSSFVAWGLAVAASALLLGFVSKQAGSTLQGNSTVQRVLTRLGAPGLSAKTYLGVAFLIVAVMGTFVAAGHLGGARAEEAEGRVEHLLVRCVSRWSWFGGRLVVATVVLVTLGLSAGVFAWVGAASQHAGINFASLFGAGLNTVPPALCVLGIGALVLGMRPRAAPGAMYGLIAWSFLVEIIGGAVNLDHWVLDTSVFHQMSAAPAVRPNWATAGAMVATGVMGAAIGLVAFRRRDLVGE